MSDERERAEQLLENLRSIVELHSGDTEEMIGVTLAFAREERARVWEEARGLLLAQQCHEPFYGSAIYKQVVVDFARWIDKLVDMFAARAAALREGRDGTDYTLLSQL